MTYEGRTMTDRSTDQKRFDPRFDPAFQPGYDPRNDPAIAARNVQPSSAAEGVVAPRPPRPDFVNAPPERITTGQHRAVSSNESADSHLEPVADREQEADDAAPANGTNPFVIVLWVVAVLLVAAGITLFRAIPGLEQQTAGTQAPVSFAQLFGFGALAAVLIGAGALVAAGNLFFLAARWRGRRGRGGE